VKLSDVTRIEVDRGYQRLFRHGTRRTVTVYADVDLDLGTSQSVNQIMKARFRDIPDRYPGVGVIFGGEYQETDRSLSDLRRAFGIAVLAIFGILAAQFRSYVQPLLVMSVIVFSFIGVITGMAIMNLVVGGYALSMYVMYAIVGLAGIVVNDSLVLIDFINKARDRGASPIEAVVEGSRKRFRPILLTTVTTVTGLLPMAVGITGYSRVFGPFATAIVFGLSVASLLTLFVVPTLYLTLEDGKIALARRFGRVSDGIGEVSPPPIRSAGS
jgi:HAE1 family hydrophobic/amphiphilic exporter-1